MLFDRGDEIVVQAGPEGIRFLLVSGKPLEEPVAWYGPIVMNTEEELRQAIDRITFIRHIYDADTDECELTLHALVGRSPG